jgi:hypothetical protein
MLALALALLFGQEADGLKIEIGRDGACVIGGKAVVEGKSFSTPAGR